MRTRAPLAASLALVLAFSASARAETPPPAGVHGKFIDPTTQAPVAGVLVTLARLPDTTEVHRATARDDGTFTLPGIAPGAWRIEATRLGFSPLRTTVQVLTASQDLGALALTPQAVKVGGITVTESPAPAVVHGDTTEFRASAVKTNPDATAEDLVQKLPGVTVENGQVKAQGEQVQQVLVNGRPFFGSDPTVAMRNLPADVVDRIQVYDRMSDQAEFSGFDDGQSQKTMNFILRDRKVRFGKAYGGYGDRDRYQAGGNLSVIRGATRLTLIGLSNNVNQQNFSAQDLIGALSGNGGGGGPRGMFFGGPRGGGGGNQQFFRGGGGLGGNFDPGNFLVGQQSGLTTTHSGGFNLTAQPSRTLTFTSSVFANATHGDNAQTLSREYVPPQDSTEFYDQSSRSDARNRNLRIDGRVEWTPDSLNSVIFAPRLYFQSNHTTGNNTAGYTGLSGSPLATSDGSSTNDTHGNNLSERLTLRHRFARPGRNISADLSAGHTLRNGDRGQRSLSDFFMGDSVASDTLDELAHSNSATNTYSTRIAYTEPLAARLRLQLIYSPSITHSDADARANALDPLTGAYDVPDSAQSNSFLSRSTTQNGGVALLFTPGPWRWLFSTHYQELTLRSEQTWPASRFVDQTFTNVLPSVMLTGNFSNRRTLRLSWGTSTSTPGIGQLQNVVDRSNPLAVTAGNPSLRATYNHNLSLRWSEADPQHSRSRFLFLNVTRTSNPISNATFTAPSDTVLDGIALARGTQLTRPLNLDVSWSANAFGVYSRPLKLLKSIVSVNGGGTFTQTPTRLQTGINVARNWGLREGVTLASNISPNLDFTLSYQGTYNLSRNTLSTSTTGDYYSHVIGLRFNGIARHGIVVREEVTHNLQSGVATGYGRDDVLWNTTLGKKFLKDNRGELRVTLTDALSQDRSVSRTVTESYVQDVHDEALGRFAQAVFTYTFR
jgi:hypothetical protein